MYYLLRHDTKPFEVLGSAKTFEKCWEIAESEDCILLVGPHDRVGDLKEDYSINSYEEIKEYIEEGVVLEIDL